MDANEVMRIKEIINKAKEESLKAQGAISSIKKDWKEKYGTDDYDELKKEYEQLNEKVQNLRNRQAVVMEELQNACDWQAIRDKLGMR